MLTLSPETLKNLGSESPLKVRLAEVDGLSTLVRQRRMDEGGVELLWMKTKDLCEVASSNPAVVSAAVDASAVRHSVLTLYANLVEGQFECLDVMRAYFFRVIEGRVKVEEDIEVAIGLLDGLTSEN